MEVQGRTVLITGGTSGIGLELAKQFIAMGNTVVVTGRDSTKMEQVADSFPQLHVIQCDVTDTAAIDRLVQEVTARHPDLSLLINNAGIMRERDILATSADRSGLTLEVETNLNGPIHMTAAFLPLLRRQPTAAVMNVSSGIAFLPMPASPVYSAAKAGLHAWSVALRLQLASTNVKVFELAPPLTKTPLGTDTFDPEVIRGIPFMSPKKVAVRAIEGIRRNRFEIRPGMSNVMKLVGRLAPNALVDAMLKSTVVRMREVSAKTAVH